MKTLAVILMLISFNCHAGSLTPVYNEAVATGQVCDSPNGGAC